MVADDLPQVRLAARLQQEQLLDWQAALEAEQVFSDCVVPYHFPAMNSPPFFVKGIIARAMSESYEGKVPMAQAGVMYLDDLDEFAGAIGLQVDDQPTLVIADGQGKPLQVIKGTLSDSGLADAVLTIRAAGEPQAAIDFVSEVEMESAEDPAE